MASRNVVLVYPTICDVQFTIRLVLYCVNTREIDCDSHAMPMQAQDMGSFTSRCPGKEPAFFPRRSVCLTRSPFVMGSWPRTSGIEPSAFNSETTRPHDRVQFIINQSIDLYFNHSRIASASINLLSWMPFSDWLRYSPSRALKLICWQRVRSSTA